MKIFGGLIASIALFASALAHGADEVASLSLEDLLKVEVEGASRYLQPLSEAPSSVGVVTANDIRQFGFRNLADALQSQSGVYQSYDRAYTYLGVRGFGRPGDYNSRVLLMVDGGRRNDVLYDQAMLGNESPVELDWVKRIEFVPGPASSIYGGNALFGIVNAILWSGADVNGSRVAVEAGSGGMGRAGLLAGQLTDAGVDWITGLSVYRRRGDDQYFREFDAPGVGDGVARGLDGERNVKFFAKAGRDGWQASINLASRSKDVPTAYYGTVFNAPGNFVRDRSATVDLSHAATLVADWSHIGRAYLGYYAYDADYPYVGVANRDESRANWWGVDYRATYTGLRAHKLILGAEYRRDGRVLQRNFDVEPPAMRLDNSQSGSVRGIFVQDEWRMTRQWLLNLGLRADRYSVGGEIISPRAALIFRPASSATIKLMAGSAFRPPNAYERYYGDGITSKSSPDLEPEYIRTRELAADYALSPALRLKAAHYRYTIRGLIDQTPDPVDGLLIYRNQAPMQAHGWQLELETVLSTGWRARGGLSWQSVEQAGGVPSNMPRRLGKLMVDGPLPGFAWTIGVNLQGVGARNSLAASVPGYVTGNLVMRQARPERQGVWSMAFYNLGNLRFLDPGAREHSEDALPQDGRQLRVRWEIGF